MGCLLVGFFFVCEQREDLAIWEGAVGLEDGN